MGNLKLILLAAAAVIGLAVFFLLPTRQPLEGEITEVRTLGMERTASVGLVNFAVTNNTSNPVVIYGNRLAMIDSDGHRHPGSNVAVPDVKQLFDYFSELGGMGDVPLMPRTEVPAGEKFKGLAGARFEVPKHELDGRQDIVLTLTDGLGRDSELRLTPAP